MGKNNEKPLRTVLVGCGRMGRYQAELMAEAAEFELTAVCDANADAVRETASRLRVQAYNDFETMLTGEKPDIVVICTANDTHARFTIMAARAGVRGIYCEKPMATNMRDARMMVEICSQHEIKLVVNHQRRIGADLREARRLIETGVLGELKLFRGQCAGDILSDGTHLIDSLMWLAGDPEIAWVFGQIHRQKGKENENQGYRFGHPVETGGVGVIQTKPGLRMEVLCGDMIETYRAYQDYEIVGTKARLWRTGDRHQPNLFIQDGYEGEWAPGLDEWVYKPIPVGKAVPGGWRPVAFSPDVENAICVSFRQFASMVRAEAEHPMNGRTALQGFEVLMGIYESSRLRAKVELPLLQARFPLELMIENGEL